MRAGYVRIRCPICAEDVEAEDGETLMPEHSYMEQIPRVERGGGEIRPMPRIITVRCITSGGRIEWV